MLIDGCRMGMTTKFKWDLDVVIRYYYSFVIMFNESKRLQH